MRVFCLYRNGKALLVNSDTIIREGDNVYFIAKKKHITRTLKEFRRAENIYQKIFIAGGGILGLNVAKLLEETRDIRIIELNENRATKLADQLNNAVVLQGNASDEDLLLEEGIDSADLFLALTDSDEVNVIVSILAKRLGAHKTFALVKRDVYASVAEQSDDIDMVLSPDQITVSGILSHIRKGDTMKVHSLQHGLAEALEIVVHGDENSSKVVGRKIKDIELPEGAVVGAIVRNNDLLVGSKKLVIEQGDHVLLMLTDISKIHQVEAIFTENIE